MDHAAIYKFKQYELLLTASDKGITSLSLYKDQDLTEFNMDSKMMQKHMLILDNYFKGIKPEFSDFDVKGTDFQMLVWKAIFDVPFGKTVSYLDIALKLAKPNASRAIGSALGKNAILILIPCHRAIRKNGELGGFNTIVSLKKDLIDFEKTYVR